MRLHVLLEVGAAGEAVFADLAGEGFLTGVYALMTSHIAQL